jgi:hypothetical protein
MLQIGDLKIPFFEKKTKDGTKSYFATEMRIFVNAKKDPVDKKPETEDIL